MKPHPTYIYSDGNHTWSVRDIWEAAAELPVEQVEVGAIPELGESDWLMDEVMRVLQADLNRPIILGPTGEVVDGWHRIARARMDGRTRLPCRRLVFMPEPLTSVENRT